MGSDESHFNVSVGSVGQSQDSVHKHNLFEEKGEPKRVSNRGPSAYQPNALPLGQTGSHKRKQDQHILLKVQDTDLAAREAHYHATCQRNYTREDNRHQEIIKDTKTIEE